MSQTHTQPEAGSRAALTAGASSLAVETIRAKMMEGRATVPDFAKAIGVSPRTVFSYIAAGMPVEHVGRTPLALIDPALEWLRSRRGRQTAPPRGRGRPRAT